MRAQRSNIVQATNGSGVAGSVFGGLMELIMAPSRARLESEDFIQKQNYLHGHRKDLINTEYDRRDTHARVKGDEERKTITHENEGTVSLIDQMIARPGVRQARGITLDGSSQPAAPAAKPTAAPEPAPIPLTGTSVTNPFAAPRYGSPTPAPVNNSDPAPKPRRGSTVGAGRGARSLPGFSLASMKTWHQSQGLLPNKSGKK